MVIVDKLNNKARIDCLLFLIRNIINKLRVNLGI
jgi:hypothetical protein